MCDLFVVGLTMPISPPLLPNTPTQALWDWQTNGIGQPPTVIAYSNGRTTKTGLQPQDLRSFAGVPLQYNYTPPVSFTDAQLLDFIRQAEDWVEQNSGITLCETWIASPVVGPTQIRSTGIVTKSGGGQIQGIDYDLIDVGYDFFYRRFIMQGWGIQQMRYRPLRDVYYLSFIYPLLSEFFQIPAIPPVSWIVEDHDYGMIRIVPSANVQMLPLFAMQLSFMGFAQSLPQAMYFQYTAGLTQVDYATRYRFMYTLVLSQAAVIALMVAQGSINFGANKLATSVDGLRFETGYNNAGAFAGLITTFQNQANNLLQMCIELIRGGPTMISL